MYIHFNHHSKFSIKRIWGTPERDIIGVYYDSRRVSAGSVFVCMRGENHDGHIYLKEAIEKGANVIVGEDPERLEEGFLQYPNVTFILTENARSFLAHISVLFYGRVHEKIQTVGVTGTNGKTTVAAYVRSLMKNLGMPSGSIGTIGMFTSKGRMEFSQTTPTTPESIDLHSIFHQMYLEGDQLASMEVTSVAIEQKRVEGINFEIAIHTNLTPEHLEFHQTFENYRNAKLKLFRQAKKAVVNIDDKGMSAEILEIFNGPVLTYSLDKNSGADVIASNIKMSAAGTVFEMIVKGESYIVRAPIFGNYNVANILAAVCAALHSGFTVQEILPAITMLESPEGRLEVLQDGNRNIILDYAHTPPALKNLISEVKKMPHRRLIVMIMGIGIRDWEKMPQMAQAIEGEADEIVVSVDHPGFHDPEDIINKVLTGFKNPRAGNIHRAPTRREGVLTSLDLSGEQDLIILTSGCINGAQLVKGERIPHSDKDIIENYFKLSKPARNVEFVQG